MWICMHKKKQKQKNGKKFTWNKLQSKNNLRKWFFNCLFFVIGAASFWWQLNHGVAVYAHKSKFKWEEGKKDRSLCVACTITLKFYFIFFYFILFQFQVEFFEWIWTHAKQRHTNEYTHKHSSYSVCFAYNDNQIDVVYVYKTLSRQKNLRRRFI